MASKAYDLMQIAKNLERIANALEELVVLQMAINKNLKELII